MPRTKIKPWGQELIWADVEGKYLGKVLYISDGHQLSLQYHKEKDETIRVLKGTLELEIQTWPEGFVLDPEEIKKTELIPETVKHKLVVGECFHIQPKTIHRMFARYGNVEVMEVSTWGPMDVVRLKDSYGREGT